VANQHRGRRTGNAGHAVMFGHPVTLIAPALGMLGDIQGVPKGFRSVASFGNGRQVENGKRYLGHYLQVGAEPDKTSRNFYGIVSLLRALAQPVRATESQSAGPLFESGMRHQNSSRPGSTRLGAVFRSRKT